MSSSNKVLARSFLFVPGDRPERFDKALSSGAHAIVLDLEDAVAPAAKPSARDAAADWLAHGADAFVRVNAVDTPWFEDDLRMVAAAPNARVMLSKADVAGLASVGRLTTAREIIALLETVAAFMQLRDLAAQPNLSRIAFGSVDFGIDAGIVDEGEALTLVRTQIVLESKFARLAAPIDGVSVSFDDENGMRVGALRSRQLGFGGKLCIHPRQVSVVNAAFQPTPDEVQWAKRVIAAFEASQGGATTVDGAMIDKPVVERARRILAETR